MLGQINFVCRLSVCRKTLQDYGNKFNQIRHPDLFGLRESQKLILTPVQFSSPHYPLPLWIPKINIFTIWPTKMPLGSKMLSSFTTISQHLIWRCSLYCDPSDPKCATSDSHHSANMFGADFAHTSHICLLQVFKSHPLLIIMRFTLPYTPHLTPTPSRMNTQ